MSAGGTSWGGGAGEGVRGGRAVSERCARSGKCSGAAASGALRSRRRRAACCLPVPPHAAPPVPAVLSCDAGALVPPLAAPAERSRPTRAFGRGPPLLVRSGCSRPQIWVEAASGALPAPWRVGRRCGDQRAAGRDCDLALAARAGLPALAARPERIGGSQTGPRTGARALKAAPGGWKLSRRRLGRAGAFLFGLLPLHNCHTKAAPSGDLCWTGSTAEERQTQDR